MARSDGWLRRSVLLIFFSFCEGALGRFRLGRIFFLGGGSKSPCRPVPPALEPISALSEKDDKLAGSPSNLRFVPISIPWWAPSEPCVIDCTQKTATM